MSKSPEFKLKILAAYPYITRATLEAFAIHNSNVNFLIDSGAFTAFKSGKKIDLDAYCKFIETLPAKPWGYFTLDVIGDPGRSLENYETMLKRGFKPIPIFTRGEHPSVLEEYYKTSEIVGLGGLVGSAGKIGYLKGLMPYVNGRRVHILGIGMNDIITAFTPYSCDSSHYSRSTRFGIIDFYMGRGKFIQYKRGTHLGKSDLLEINRRYGLTPRQLADPGFWKNGSVQGNAFAKVPIISYFSYSMEVVAKLGTSYFLAMSDTWLNEVLNRSEEFLCLAKNALL